MFEAGDQVAGWRVISRLGSRVWHCRSAHPLREAAVRLIRTPKGPSLHARLEALRRARHAGAAAIEEVSALDEYTLIAMTLARGRTLAEICPRDPREQFAIARQLAESVAHSHALGVCHGALRLEHVRIGADKRPMLIDPWLPQHGASPRAQIPSIEDDVSALGAMLFTMYTGRTAGGTERGLDPGSGAPPPVRDWILRATSQSAAASTAASTAVLRERLIALEGTVAVLLPRAAPRAPATHSPEPARAAPAREEPPTAESARPPKPVDPSLLLPPDDALPREIVWLGLLGLVGSVVLPVVLIVTLLLARLV